MARTTLLALVLAAGALLATGGAAMAEPEPSALELRVVVDDCPEARP
ncbi:hypothetical protein ACIBF7_22675 [Nonomuraea sp. NPDC050478]|uniref:Uncharacterized protein n=1 Tax=Nonomuraea harbinensis TaxID=1286938 RepID=A0ABW1BV00_9ACTN|nr:hypothetical protein [Nonomuraea harbinensis]